MNEHDDSAEKKTNRKRKIIISVIAIVLVLIIVAVILCVTLIPANNKTSNNNSSGGVGGISGEEPYKIGETFSNRNGDIIFTGISAKHGLTVNDIEYSGYYLIASAVASSEEFLGSTANARLRKYQEEGEIPPYQTENMPFNPEVTNALSMSREEENEEDSENPTENDETSDFSGGKTDNLLIFNYVYDLTQEQYEYLYEMRNTYNAEREERYQHDIRIDIAGSGYLIKPGWHADAYFIFFCHEIRFEEELQ